MHLALAGSAGRPELMGETKPMFFVDASGDKPVVRWRLLLNAAYGYVPVVADAQGTVLLGAVRDQSGK